MNLPKMKWLRQNKMTEFVQFAHGRIQRQEFPLGGYIYTTTVCEGKECLNKETYNGNELDKAYAALHPAKAEKGA